MPQLLCVPIHRALTAMATFRERAGIEPLQMKAKETE